MKSKENMHNEAHFSNAFFEDSWIFNIAKDRNLTRKKIVLSSKAREIEKKKKIKNGSACFFLIDEIMEKNMAENRKK